MEKQTKNYLLKLGNGAGIPKYLQFLSRISSKYFACFDCSFCWINKWSVRQETTNDRRTVRVRGFRFSLHRHNS